MSNENKFRKKPVVIEAVQWKGNNDIEIMEFMKNNCLRWQTEHDPDKKELIIHTLEGDHHANINDWIIKGVHGEYYPCKPDIFEKTYEPASLSTLSPDGMVEEIKFEICKAINGDDTSCLPKICPLIEDKFNCAYKLPALNSAASHVISLITPSLSKAQGEIERLKGVLSSLKEKLELAQGEWRIVSKKEHAPSCLTFYKELVEQIDQALSDGE